MRLKPSVRSGIHYPHVGIMCFLSHLKIARKFINQPLQDYNSTRRRFGCFANNFDYINNRGNTLVLARISCMFIGFPKLTCNFIFKVAFSQINIDQIAALIW